MKTTKIFLGTLFMSLFAITAQAQTLKLAPENGMADLIIATNASDANIRDHIVELGYNDFATVALSSNYPFHNISTQDNWLSWKIQKNGNIAIFADPNYNLDDREGFLYLSIDNGGTTTEGLATDIIRVVQKGKKSSDKQITIKSGTASQAESGFLVFLFSLVMLQGI